MDPALFELTESGSQDDEVSVIMRLKDESRAPDNVRVVARFGPIITARLRRSEIRRTWESDLVASMKASRPVAAPLPYEDPFDDNEQEGVLDLGPGSGPARSYTEDGTGVLVGVCDWGLDFTHPNFRNADGTTRLRMIWDQKGHGGRSPEPYGYGRLHSREEINAALRQPDPFKALGYDLHHNDRGNRGTHGTHVTDIVAGNRRVPGSTAGIASGAELIFVQLTSQKMDETADFGDSVCLLEALDFIRRNAENDPCVINLSAGKTGGGKRGASPFEQAVDAMLLSRKNLALVQSVGNYASTAMHTHARIGPDQSHTLRWKISPRDRTPNELEVWYDGRDVFEVSLIAPTGERYTVKLGDRMRLEEGGKHWGNFYHRRNEPNTGLNHIDIFLQPSAPAGTWQIELHGSEIVDGRLHAWIERDAGGRHQSRFPREQATSSYTINTICNSFRGIAVGAYDATQPDRPPTRFSSRGPTADGRQKPELAAPGYRIRAARSMPEGGWRDGESKHTIKSGTSMAAPHVAGTVALMFQAAQRPLSINEVRRVLIGTADPHPGPPGRTSTQLGYGYLNPAAAIEAVRRLTTTGSTKDLAARSGLRHESYWEAEPESNWEEQAEQDEMALRYDITPSLDFGDEHFNEEDFGTVAGPEDDLEEEDCGDEDFDDEDYGDEDYGDEDHEPQQVELDDARPWEAPPQPEAPVFPVENHESALAAPDAFAMEIDEMGIDPEAAFRSGRDRSRSTAPLHAPSYTMSVDDDGEHDGYVDYEAELHEHDNGGGIEDDEEDYVDYEAELREYDNGGIEDTDQEVSGW